MVTTNRTHSIASERTLLDFSLGQVPPELSIPVLPEISTPVEYAEALGTAYLAFAKRDRRKNAGHYQTPASVARFMAERLSYSKSSLRVLDPGSGTGILSAAVCKAASASGTVQSLHIDAYEVDPLLTNLTQLVLDLSREWLIQRGITLTFDVKHEDFVLASTPTLDAMSKNNGRVEAPGERRAKYDLVICNPPYFKIGKRAPLALMEASALYGQPNIYSAFMAVAANLIADAGTLVFIVPRSFASGPYFRRFREKFFRRVAPTAIHLFESRRDVFKNQAVLQESLVITARGRTEDEASRENRVLVSHSRGAHDLANRHRFTVGSSAVLNLNSVNKELCIPTCADDLELMQVVRSWPNTLRTLGLDVSTGPVVPFRSTPFLSRTALGGSTVPLLWMHNVLPMRIEWPLTDAGKPQWIRSAAESRKNLVMDDTHVLLRRFSAKEERRRLVAAPSIRGCLDADMVGLENHLNYIHRVSRILDEELAWGLSAILNSTFLDRYFRLFNGNTQVNATELRAMPLPSEAAIRVIGAEVGSRLAVPVSLDELDVLVAQTLGLTPELPRD